MTKQVWIVERGTVPVDVTAEIQSMQYSTGRRTQFDSWSPGSLVLSIKNNVGQANSYNLNDQITLSSSTSGFFQFFYVQEVLYNDLGGTGAGSTATIVCTDLLGRMGRIQVFEQYLNQTTTLTQLDNEFNALMPTSTYIVPNGAGDSQAAAETYTGTVLNRLNLNMVTEQGWLSVTDNGVYLYARSRVDDLAPGSIVFARQGDGPYQMGYSDIKRITLGSNYLNTCTVIPTSVAQQNSSDATGVAAFGYYGAEFSTVDNTIQQAKDFASWQVYSRSDPAEVSFQISVSDLNNDLDILLGEIYINQPVVTVSYEKPGSPTDYVSAQIMQGWTMTVTPSATFMEIFTSPLTYTNFFTLDSSTFGRLGGSGVTYNSEIFYNQSDYTYNDTTAENAGRLGW
jgi:hypothetical protein